MKRDVIILDTRYRNTRVYLEPVENTLYCVKLKNVEFIRISHDENNGIRFLDFEGATRMLCVGDTLPQTNERIERIFERDNHFYIEIS